MPKWTDQQRDAIADRGHSLIVCAAAGSGKTAVLVERIVQLVREGCPIENMLVVTFTNAAAGEMRQRIGEALSRAAREEPALGEQVMALSRASISTLHRFCGSLLREHFQALAIDPGFRIGDEQECGVLSRQAMEDAIYSCYEVGSDAFLAADRCYAQEELGEFLRMVNVGHAQVGFNAFLDKYLDSLLTNGRAVGEIVPDAEGREIAAVLCADVSQVEVREGDNPLEFCLCGVDGGGRSVPLEYQDLLLFTPLNPEAGHPYGVSMLRSMPYLTGLLLKIYDAMGKNWDRCGNVRFAVTYKPQDGELDRGAAQERAEQIAEEWSRAMQEGRNGSVRDFVSVGDVSIKAIGADNQILDSETPVRQILEQLVAKTGLPPFMLGLNWSSTERMSSQQADMLTSEITALRRTLEPVIERVCTLWLRMHGYGCRAVVDWEDINLQDEVEEAKAALYLQQARKLRQENDEAEGK